MDIYTLALSIAYSNKIGKQIEDQAFKTEIKSNRDILNTTGEEEVFYFLPKENGKPQNGYDEYIFFNNNWELMGSTEIDLSNYYTKTEIDNMISNIETLHFEIVQQRPLENIKTNTIYLIPSNNSENENVYEEWVYVNNNWELIGSTNIDLSSYITNTEATQKINENKIKTAIVNQNGTVTFTLNDDSTITTSGTSVIGKQGEPGQDYILTNQDKDDIANLVLQKIPDADTMNF